MDQNLQIMDLAKHDLSNSIKTVTAQVSNGIATKSNEDLLNAELLKTEQQIIEFNSVKKQAMQILGILTRADMDKHTILAKPEHSYDITDTVIKRPELKLFDFQQQSFQLESKLINAKTNPTFSFFANGGYGKPGLNQLKNQFDWFYITGVKLKISVMARITQQKDKAVLRIQEQVVAKQKENFLINNQQLLVRQKNEMDKYRQLVLTDSSILTLRTRIKENALVRLSNGIINTDDYIRELNAENQARLNQQLHEVSLLQAQYNYKVIVTLLTMIGTFLSSLNIVHEKELGTIEQINVSPINKSTFILGKLIPFWIMGLVTLTIGLLVSRLFYHIVPIGNVALIYLFAMVFLLALLGVGLLIPTYSETQTQATFVGFFVMMIFMLLGGLYTSIDSMPAWAKWITKINPVAYFIEVMRMIVLKGSGFTDIKFQLLSVFGLAVVFNSWAILNYRKRA